ncbi:MAG: hypothetical protein INQ03_05650 [Candidatus Heimdallarchaeota archaeon]|nr:hypothetical protein [Candidatus Heimdallarchaeota archaeon]
MALVNRPSFEESTNRGIIERIFDRPAIIFLILVGTAMYFAYGYAGSTQDLLLPSVLFISPVLPAIVLEGRWKTAIRKSQANSGIFYDLIKENRLGFIFAGIILSFIMAFVSFLMELILNKGNQFGKFMGIRYTYVISYPHLLTLALCSAITGLIIAASFYRIRAEEHDTGKRYTFISTPLQIVTFTSYAFMSAFIIIWVLWMGQHLISQIMEIGPVNINVVTSNSFGFTYLILFNLLFSVGYFSKEIPKIIQDSNYHTPSRQQLLFWVRDIGVVIISSSFIMMYRFNHVYRYYHRDWIILDSVLVISLSILILYTASKMTAFGETCEYCNLLMHNNACPSCDSNGRGKLLKFKSKGKFLFHPSCPRCGITWNNLERTCQNPECKYSIVLSCQYCGYHINPLWKKCIRCGKERETIINRALKAPGSEGYVRSIAYLKVFTAFLIIILILQASLLFTVVSQILEIGQLTTNQAYLAYALYTGITKSLVLTLAILGILGLMMVTNIERTRAVGLVANRLAIAPASVLMLSIFFFFVLSSLENIRSISGTALISKLLILALSLFFLYGSIKGSYRLLLQFRMVTPFNPKLALSRRIKSR